MDTGGIEGGKLQAFVQRYERLQDEIDELNGDRAALIKEVSRAGFDKAIFKIVIKRRLKGKDGCDQEDMFVQLYERALDEPAHSRARAREAEPMGDAVAGALSAYGI